MRNRQLDYFERQAKRRRSWYVQRVVINLLMIVLLLAVITVAWIYVPQWAREMQARERSVYYPNCAAARAAGAAPIRIGEPGYRPELDADNDGIACEPVPLWER